VSIAVSMNKPPSATASVWRQRIADPLSESSS
jgi:hypothetical protein